MTTETLRLHELLRDLVASYTDHTHALELAAKEVPGAVYWTLRGHADDYGKLVGKSGAHVKALGYLVTALGVADGELFTFKLLEPEPAPRRPSSPVKEATKYDPKPAGELLTRLLGELGIGQYAVTGITDASRVPIFVTYEIAVRDAEDYSALTVGPTEGEYVGQTLIGALGTLFRARANRDGVRFQLNVIKP